MNTQTACGPNADDRYCERYWELSAENDRLREQLTAQQMQPAPKIRSHPDDLFEAWWDETYEADEGPQSPDRHVPRDAFRAGWDHARALLAPNGVAPQTTPKGSGEPAAAEPMKGTE